MGPPNRSLKATSVHRVSIKPLLRQAGDKYQSILAGNLKNAHRRRGSPKVRTQRRGSVAGRMKDRPVCPRNRTPSDRFWLLIKRAYFLLRGAADGKFIWPCPTHPPHMDHEQSPDQPDALCAGSDISAAFHDFALVRAAQSKQPPSEPKNWRGRVL